MRILIVDDSKAMRAIVRRALRQADLGDHSIEEAANGREGLSVIKQSPPDLVLCDVNMPEMSGLELLRTMKQEGLTPRFGFVTSEATAELRVEASKAGALFVITKPFSPDVFSETLGPIINGSVSALPGADQIDNGAAPRTSAPLTPELTGVLLRDLLGRAVTVKKSTPMALTSKAPFVIAVYSAGPNPVAHLCICDLALAASVGAALCMLPAGSIQDTIRAGTLAPAVESNLHEVFNVMSRLFGAAGTAHASLTGLHLPSAPLPAAEAKLMSCPANRLDVEVNVSGYGAGRLAYVFSQ